VEVAWPVATTAVVGAAVADGTAVAEEPQATAITVNDAIRIEINDL
jgi:hypothetical protein